MSMLLSEKLCRWCGDNFEAFVFFHSIKDIAVIQKLELPITNGNDRICGFCYAFIDKIQRFCEQSIKVQDFLLFINTVKDIDDRKIDEIRREYEISLRRSQSTDTNAMVIEQQFAVDGEKCTEVIAGDRSFTELAELTEIPTISLNDQSFVIENISEVDHEDDDIADEIEISYSTAEDEKPLETESQATNDFKFICHVCSNSFENFLSLHNHTRKLHDTIPQVQCVCNKTLFTRAQVNLHKKLHSLTKSFKCSFCDKMYSHQQSLQNHLKKAHANETKHEHSCSKCSRHFETEKKLKVHQLSHKSDGKKLTHPCPFSDCDRKFSKSVNVQAHVKTVHVKERPFLCSDCGKSFGTKGALKEHQIIHSSDLPFACKFCPKKFKNMPRLKTHEDTHAESSYICTECGLALNTKRTLKMHMVVHSDNKKFKCSYCSSSFKRSKALKNHLILHTGLRPYSCPFCEKTFANGSNCRSHKKKSHPEELAAFEASGKLTSAPSIPRLEQLMSSEVKGDQQLVVSEQKTSNEDQYSHSLIVDGSNLIIQSSASVVENYEIQQILPKEMMEMK